MVLQQIDRYPLVFCIALFLIASFATTFVLPAFHSSDEYGYMASAREMMQGKFAKIGDVNRFPLFPVLLSVLYSILGYSELVTNLLLAIIGVATLAIFYEFLAKPHLNKNGAFIATLIFATNPLFLYLSTRVLTESLFILLFVIFAVLLLKATASRLHSVLLGVVVGLLFATRYVGLVAIPIAVAYFVYLYVSSKKLAVLSFSNLLIALIGFVLTTLLFSWLVFGEPFTLLSGFLSFFSQQTSGLNEAATFSLPDKIPFYVPFIFVLLGFASPLLWKALLGYKQFFKNNLLAASGISVVIFWLALEVYGVFNVALLRYIAPIIPFLALFAGSVNLPFNFREFKINRRHLYVAIIFNLLVAVSIFGFFASYPKYVGYREAGQWAAEHCASVNSNIQKIVKHYSNLDEWTSNSTSAQCTVISSYDGKLLPPSGQGLVFESHGVKVYK